MTSPVDTLAALLLDRLTGPLTAHLVRELGLAGARPANDADEPWISTDDLASRLSVNSETVRRWIGRGCPAANVGSGKRPVYRVRVSEVQGWLDARGV